jgi:hypothetical protein
MLRWEEEHKLVSKEMDRVAAYFDYQASQTLAWGTGLHQTQSQHAWAKRCAATWVLLKVNAERHFVAARKSLADYLNDGVGSGTGKGTRYSGLGSGSGTRTEKDSDSVKGTRGTISGSGP